MFQRLTNRVRTSRRDFRNAIQYKKKLLSSMQHELRTPISTIVGCLEVLSNRPSKTMQTAFITKGRAASFQLLREIETITEVADIGSPNIRVNNQQINLMYLVDHIAAEFLMSHQGQNCQLRTKCLPQSNISVSTDSSKVSSICLGLLNSIFEAFYDHAIQWTVDLQQTRLELTFQCTSSKEETVEFKRFWLNDAMLNDSQRGWDYDKAAIVKYYMQLMPATLLVERNAGKCVVSLTIPVGYTIEEDLFQECSVKINGEFAVVDDLETSRDYLKYLIESAGGKVRLFESSTGLLQSLNQGDNFDAIVLDVHMPQVSGLETLDMLTAMKNRFSVIMISADPAALGNITADYDIVQQVFSKPIDSRRFLDTLASAKYRNHLPEPQKINILIVEDDPISSEFVVQILTGFGFRSIAAQSGSEARKILQTHRFDVALIDLNLPDETGYSLASFIKQHLPYDKQPRMLALTANTLEKDRQQSLKAGMQYHICKPVYATELKRAIELVLIQGNSSERRND
ncbi:response regulator [Alteromonas flava]|uniref:response regulator n=1 Tax=Alteromonas flava TaxID=2048003 RepID=UPI0013DA6A85|nr:response regulator [Alteromonas flava]